MRMHGVECIDTKRIHERNNNLCDGPDVDACAFHAAVAAGTDAGADAGTDGDDSAGASGGQQLNAAGSSANTNTSRGQCYQHTQPSTMQVGQLCCGTCMRVCGLTLPLCR